MDDIKHGEPAALELPVSLRDYFAGRSLHGLVQHWGNTTTPELARRAYELADAMLAERAK